MQPERFRIALADDSYLMREAIGQVLGGLAEMDVVAVCADGDSLLEAVDGESPDVVVTDLRMPPGGDGEGIRVAHQLRETHPHVGVVVLSQFAEPHHGAALMANGAEGRAYLLKDRVHDREELRAAVEIVARGGSMIDPRMMELLLSAQGRRRDSPLNELTPRERDVLSGMAQGKSNAAIAQGLVVTTRAVEKHVGAIFLKLGLPDEAVASRRVSAVLLYLAEAPPDSLS
ncbi:MAG TPA: response regulator transcription factor [Gaiellaceae bacterium]|nr:response regulator transcription factor [Gaiellaceae bacterium]